MNKTKGIIKWLLILISITITLAIAIPIAKNDVNVYDDNYEPADGFTVDSFDIKMNVNKDNTVDVKETININFYEQGHHGIYRVIPRWLQYTSTNGETYKRRAKISNLRTYGD